MTTNLYRKLELIEETPKTAFRQLILSWLTNVGETILQALIAQPNYEPEITELRGRDGESFWKVYEPLSGKIVYCMTENEVLDWLDTCHRRQ